MDRFKKKPLNFTKEYNGRDIRAYKRSVDRKSARHLRLSSIRNLDACLESSLEPDSSVFEATVNKGVPKASLQAPSRLVMLKKWKEEKELKKVLEQRSRKPLFVCSKRADRSISVPINLNKTKLMQDSSRMNSSVNSRIVPAGSMKQDTSRTNFSANSRGIPAGSMKQVKEVPSKIAGIKNSIQSMASKAQKSMNLSALPKLSKTVSQVQKPPEQKPSLQKRTMPLVAKPAPKGLQLVRKGAQLNVPLKKPNSSMAERSFATNDRSRIGGARPRAALQPPSKPANKQPAAVKLSAVATNKSLQAPQVKKLVPPASFAPSNFIFHPLMNVRSYVLKTPGTVERKLFGFTPQQLGKFQTPMSESVQKPSTNNRPIVEETPSILRMPPPKKEKQTIKSVESEITGQEKVGTVAENEDGCQKESAVEMPSTVESKVDASNGDATSDSALPPVSDLYMKEILKARLSNRESTKDRPRRSKRMSFFPNGDKSTLASIVESNEDKAESICQAKLSPIENHFSVKQSPRCSRRLACRYSMSDRAPENNLVKSPKTPGTPISTLSRQLHSMNFNKPEPKNNKKPEEEANNVNKENLNISPILTPRRRSARLLSFMENVTPIRASDDVDVATSEKPISRKQRKVSLLGSPVKPGSGRRSIKGDLISFSPV